MKNKNPKNKFKTGLLKAHMIRKRYSNQTIKTYISILNHFFIHIEKDSSKITNQDVNDYIEYLIITKELSGSYHNQFLNAYVLYCKINHPENRLKFNERPKKSNFLPEVLSEEEVIQVIQSITNIKHKAIIAFIYSHGLRISECINFKLEHFNKERKTIKIVQGKGRKDRLVELNSDCRDILVDYFARYNPDEYLFKGQSKPYYSGTSIRKILERALDNCGITKHITPHSLRHSFATHLYDNGVDISKIQIILGHARPSTTSIYTKISIKTIKLKFQLKLAS